MKTLANAQGPVEIDLKLHITDGIQFGEVTIGMSIGHYSDEQSQRDRVAKFVAEEMPEGFRLMSKREWFDMKIGKAYDGQDEDGNPMFIRVAIPGGDAWAA